MAAFYDFSVTSLQGEVLPLSTYKGKVVLVVNTASKCGFTPQYQGLQSLYQTYREQGLVILGFPCNQFGQQEPGNSEAISEFCEINYGVDFPMFEKVDVKGATSHPLFVYLTDALPGLLGKNIKWNFTKFLIGRDGRPIKRYAPLTKPEALEADIKAAINADI
ncbi:redoxin domain-containing protein [Photobacterium halotolerans]|uniref:Glutathione peroxidase n=1 Tax=Photobacterium halotolerans TaxID=265726 RepID=A0A7X4WDU5_9GAMM|nr:glutathione peroxidase [Photobacterium halotolerans]NAW66942.1 redoxin domain-containing protein [Photobacterium halotolerans]NAX45719.1 redoxin domain-containing protein [Photobacterium halotolerans]